MTSAKNLKHFPIAIGRGIPSWCVNLESQILEEKQPIFWDQFCCLPYEGVLLRNRAYLSLDFSWHWLIGNYQKSEVTYPKSETVVMLNWCWSAAWWKNNLPTQITPLTQKSGPVITGGDISVIQKQQGLIFLVILWQKKKTTVVLMATSSLCYILLNE